MKYDFKKIESKWQKKWEAKKIFQVKEKSNKRKFYVLEMYPYPSASGLHMGHALNYSIGDIYARFKRMNGFNVLYPMGFDSFGLPAENAAIKAKSHPKKFTENAIKNYVGQMKELGLSYDWERILWSHNPEYYKWNQYFFLKFLENGLIYRKKAPVNWCSKCDTVLANEQVHNGKCWRHSDTDVETKLLEQWFVRTTKYAEELLSDIDKLDWPERIKIMQKNWIGKSFGTEIDFEINGEKFPVFTTRPDTLFGVTFMVVSAQHPKLFELVTKEQKKIVANFLKKIKSTKQEDLDKLDKEGVFTGSYAINPANKEKVPVWVGNFVVADYGSGMVMAVPAHDQRDFEFAKKYKLPVKIVISKEGKKVNEKFGEAYTGEGILINSGAHNCLNNREAKEHISVELSDKKLGRKKIQYKLKDWLVSRQRYWGTPIPIIYCDKCGVQPVKEKDLPVKLPEKVKFGKGNPLKTNKNFVEVKCPQCNGKAKRETDTMDTFFDSSWYYLRYCDSKNKKMPFEKNKVNYWMPVNQYIGGAEHACMHLIYARFFTKALRDLGFVKKDEPFLKLFNQGMLHGEDGFVMSKSRGNVILPEKVSKKYGIDTARMFLVSVASPDKDIDWSENGIIGSLKFVKRVIDYFEKRKFGKSSKIVESKINLAIKGISSDIEFFKYNLAIIKLRKVFESFEKEDISKKDAENFLKMFSVFCPHISEELWSNLGNKNFISLEKWPVCDEKKIDEKLEKQEEMIEKIKEDILNIFKIIESRGETKTKVYVYVLPMEKNIYDENIISEKIGKPVKIFAVNEKDKYDPTNKSKNAKPGKPAIYLE
ncbi:MAG: leucine--tRNA ligase [Nanoarchaeota archaeon]|nr:leucine--tRNA ligase [Nanoarchaeota archaeon]